MQKKKGSHGPASRVDTENFDGVPCAIRILLIESSIASTSKTVSRLNIDFRYSRSNECFKVLHRRFVGKMANGIAEKADLLFLRMIENFIE